MDDSLKDSLYNRDCFVGASGITWRDTYYRNLGYDEMLKKGLVSGPNVQNGIEQTAIEYAILNFDDDCAERLIAYLLTCGIDIDSSSASRAIEWGLQTNKPQSIKLLLDFGTIIDPSSIQSLINWAKRLGNIECIDYVENYKPSEEEKIRVQIACKDKIDRYFKNKGGRYNQSEIDRIFNEKRLSLEAKVDRLEGGGGHP